MVTLDVGPNVVDVWWAWIDGHSALPGPDAACLSADERARAERFRSVERRNAFIVERAVLRRILSRYTGSAPAALEFSYGVHGKPRLAQPREPDLSFNASHTDGLAVYSITGGRAVGVDVERVPLTWDAGSLAASVLTEREQLALRSAAPGDREYAVLRVWTLKEAFLKATGRGLTQSLKSFDVSATAGVQEIFDESTRYTLHVLDAPTDFVASLAVQGASPHIESRWWGQGECREVSP